MNGVGGRVLLSVFNYWASPICCNLSGGNFMFQIGWVSLYFVRHPHQEGS